MCFTRKFIGNNNVIFYLDLINLIVIQIREFWNKLLSFQQLMMTESSSHLCAVVKFPHF